MNLSYRQYKIYTDILTLELQNISFPLDLDKTAKIFLKRIYKNIKLNSLTYFIFCSAKIFSAKISQSNRIKAFPKSRRWIYDSSRIIKSINAAFEICLGGRKIPRLLLKYIYIFLVSASAKKYHSNWILRNLRNTFPWIKKYTFLFKKEMFCLKKLLLFFTRFSNLNSWYRSFTL